MFIWFKQWDDSVLFVNRLSIWLGIFFCAFAAQALVVIDISRFSFLPTQEGIRVLFFDLEQQKIQKINYYFKRFLEGSGPRVLYREPQQFTIFVDGSFQVGTSFDSKKFILCAMDQDGKTRATDRPDSLDPQRVIFHLSGPFKRKHASIKHTQPICSLYYRQNTDPECCALSQICRESIKANSVERGLLGERVTHLTFFTYGYVSLESQDRSNKGLDGIYEHPQRKGMFLTESKCRQESKSAHIYLKEELSEKRVAERISKIPDGEVRDYVLQFLKENPQNVWKIVQRILPNGWVQTAIASLDIQAYKGGRGGSFPFSQKDWIIELKRRVQFPKSFASDVRAILSPQGCKELGYFLSDY